jgi:hypothetical protein
MMAVCIFRILILVCFLLVTSTTHAQPAADGAASTGLANASRLYDQALQLYDTSLYGEAIPLAEEALAIRKKELGTENADVAESMFLVGLLYKDR